MTYCWSCGKKIAAEARKGDLYKLGDCCKNAENFDLLDLKSNLKDTLKTPAPR